MKILDNLSHVLKSHENEKIEYKAVLPPARALAQMIASFANSSGGNILLGVHEVDGQVNVTGLSEDFRANSITHKAVDLLAPKPFIDYGYVQYNGKKLFVIEISKSSEIVSLEGKIFLRDGSKIIHSNPSKDIFQAGGYHRISSLSSSLELLKKETTDSKFKILEHYQSILKMMDTLKHLLYPEIPNKFTEVKEGKVLGRILYSSVVDNFETYLSDILFEIYLAKPETLKSEQMVKVEDVLNCSDIQEFITFWAKQKIGKLQKGSVRGFIADNKQIKDLNIISKSVQDEIERILQIRHLYSHRNGIVDDKFLKFFPAGYAYGTEHQMSIDDILDKIEFLSDIVNKLDHAIINKYQLATL